MRYILPAITLLLFCCGSSKGQKEESSNLFNFSDSTLVTLNIVGLKDAKQAVSTHISFYQLLPGWTQSTDKVFLQEDTTLHFYIKPQHPYPATAYIGGYAIPFFVRPKDSLVLHIDGAKLSSLPEAVSVSEHKAEAAYLLKKTDALGKHDMKIYPILDRETNLTSIGRSIDSLTAIENYFFRSYPDSAELSPYFKRLEANQIYYGNAEMKLSAEDYITGYLEQELHLSREYYGFIEKTDLKREEASLSPNFLDYLSRLGWHYWKDSVQELDRKERFKVLLPNETALFDSLLPPKVADMAKAHFLTRTAARLYTHLQESIDKHVLELKDSTLRQFAQAFNQQYAASLKEKVKAPEFYLVNEKEQAYRLQSFQDSLVYISFWATSCKPCIKEFPAENALVEQFKNQPVKIVSICLDSEREKWLIISEQHGLQTLNLYAEGNWNKLLKERYNIPSFPHYALIGKQGNLIQNNTLRPGEKADSLISHYLDM